MNLPLEQRRAIYRWAWDTFGRDYHAPEQYYRWLLELEQATAAFKATTPYTSRDAQELSRIIKRLSDNRNGIKRLEGESIHNLVHRREVLKSMEAGYNAIVGRMRVAMRENSKREAVLFDNAQSDVAGMVEAAYAQRIHESYSHDVAERTRNRTERKAA